MRQFLSGSTYGNPSNTVTNYAAVLGGHNNVGTWYATETSINDVMEVAGTVSQLTIRIERSVWLGGSTVFTLRKNGADTALTVTMSPGDKIQIDKTHSVTYAAGDTISLQSAPGAGVSALQRPAISMVFTSTTAGQSVYGAGTTSNPSTAARQYNGLMACTGWGSTQGGGHLSTFAIGGTLDRIRYCVTTAPGAGKSRTFSVYLNGAEVAASIGTISDTATSVEVTGIGQAIAQGDYVEISHTSSGTPTAGANYYWSFRFDPTTDGESQVSGSCYAAPSATTNSFAGFNYALTGWNSGSQAEWNRKYTIPLPCVLSDFTVVSPYAAPGVGNTVDLWLRRNGTTATQTCQIAGTNKTANDSTHTDACNALDGLGIKIYRSTSAASSNYAWAVKVVIDDDPTVTTGRCAQPIFNGSVGQVAFNDAGYLPLMGSNGVSNSLDGYTNVSEVIPPGYSGVISDLRILLDGAPTTGSFTATLYKNGVATALTVAITSGTTGVDTTHSVSVTDGDTVAMFFQCAGGAFNIAPKGYSVKILGDNEGQFIVMGSSSDASIAWGTRVWYRPNSPEIANVASATSKDVFPMYAKLNAWRVDIGSPSAADVNTLVIYKNTLAVAATSIELAATESTGEVTGLTHQLYPGDMLSVSALSDTFDTVDAHTLKVSFLFTADTHGESWFGGGSSDDMITDGTTEYAQPQVGNVVWRTTERPALSAIACTLRDMVLFVTASAGAGYGKSYTFTTRKNGSDVNQIVVMEDETNYNMDADSTDSLSAGDYVILKVVSAGTPTANDAAWSWVVYTTPVSLSTSTPLRMLMGMGI